MRMSVSDWRGLFCSCLRMLSLLRIRMFSLASTFLLRQVDPMNTEADHLQIIALSAHLSVPACASVVERLDHPLRHKGCKRLCSSFCSEMHIWAGAPGLWRAKPSEKDPETLETRLPGEMGWEQCKMQQKARDTGRVYGPSTRLHVNTSHANGQRKA